MMMVWLAMSAGFVLAALALVLMVMRGRRMTRLPQSSRYYLQQAAGQLLDVCITLKHALPEGTGRAHVHGKLWKVKASGPMPAGSSVRITDIVGDTLIIQPNRLNS